MNKTIGIDLGTFNSAAAVSLGRQRIIMVESRYGKTLYGKNFPSFVLFDHHGKKQMVGEIARRNLRNNPKLVIWGVKRLVGLAYQKAMEKGELKRFSYDIEKGPDGGILFRVGNIRYSPSQILEFILREIKEDAEDPSVNPMLGGKIERAVISIPAYFYADRTRPITEAARNAGFPEVDTIAEPTAAAIRYGIQIDKEALLLAFDLGAGTLDVTILQVVLKDGELITGEISVSGHEAFGGIDMDDILTSYIIREYRLSEIEKDPGSMAILKEEVEKAKIRLSSLETAQLDLPTRQSINLTRKELEDVLKPLLERCRGPIRVALKEAKLDVKDLDHVLFVGGPTHMACVRQVVKDELKQLGAKKELIDEITALEERGFPIDPMECVAQGASLKAGKVVVPTQKVISEGYGTTLGSDPGLPDYYAPIIKESSNYPISGKCVICFSDPNALSVSVPIIAKRPEPDKATLKETVYKYEHLGDFTLFIERTGDLPLIEILFQVTDCKETITTLIHEQTGNRVQYERLELLKGKEIELQEHTPPPPWTEDDVENFLKLAEKKKGTWTRAHLERFIHVARNVLELVKDPANPKLKEKMNELESATEKYKSPRDCPKIGNCIIELLNTLRQPDINQITEKEFRSYLKELTEIAKRE